MNSLRIATRDMLYTFIIRGEIGSIIAKRMLSKIQINTDLFINHKGRLKEFLDKITYQGYKRDII